VKTYCPIPQQPTICAAILSSFTAEGLTQQESLTQPRRAEVILRHDPLAGSPYIVSLSSPAFAFHEWGPPILKDQAWAFATFDEARAWFDELFYANADMIIEHQRPPKREPHNGTAPWKVGDPATLGRLVSYHLCAVRTQSSVNEIASPLQTSIPSKRHACEDSREKNRLCRRYSRSKLLRHRGAVPLPTPRRHGTVVTRLSVFEMTSKCESFFSFGNF